MTNPFEEISRISIPAIDIEKGIILSMRYNFLMALEEYRIKIYNGVNYPRTHIKARIQTLFETLKPLLKRRLPISEFNRISELIYKRDITEEQIVDLFNIINTELDQMYLTRLDTIQKNIFEQKEGEL